MLINTSFFLNIWQQQLSGMGISLRFFLKCPLFCCSVCPLVRKNRKNFNFFVCGGFPLEKFAYLAGHWLRYSWRKREKNSYVKSSLVGLQRARAVNWGHSERDQNALLLSYFINIDQYNDAWIEATYNQTQNHTHSIILKLQLNKTMLFWVKLIFFEYRVIKCLEFVPS